MSEKFYPLKALALEDVYHRKSTKYFRDAFREKKIYWLNRTGETSNNKNWQENNLKRKTHTAAETKTETTSEKGDNSKSVFSGLTFTVVTFPSRVQAHSMSAIISIIEDINIKGIFSATAAHMQVSAAETPSAINTITNLDSQISGSHSGQKESYYYWPISSFIINKCIETFKFYV